MLFNLFSRGLSQLLQLFAGLSLVEKFFGRNLKTLFHDGLKSEERLRGCSKISTKTKSEKTKTSLQSATHKNSQKVQNSQQLFTQLTSLAVTIALMFIGFISPKFYIMHYI